MKWDFFFIWIGGLKKDDLPNRGESMYVVSYIQDMLNSGKINAFSDWLRELVHKPAFDFPGPQAFRLGLEFMPSACQLLDLWTTPLSDYYLHLDTSISWGPNSL